jgi:hypothetical protein
MTIAARISREWMLLLVMVLVAVVPRLALIPAGNLQQAFDPNGDSSAYIELADGLRHECGFAKLSNGNCAGAEVNRTPGYPLFLVVCMRLRIALIVQAIFWGLIVLAVGGFVYLNWGLTAALISSALISIDLPSIVYSAELMTETVFTGSFTLAILLALYAFAKVRTAKSQAYSLLPASALLALALLTRPIGEFGLIVPALLVLLMGRGSWPQKIGLQMLLLSLPGLALVGWSLRNDMVAGLAAPSSIAATNLFYYRAGGTLAFSSGSGWLNELKTMGSQPRGELTSDAFSIIVHHPVAFAAMTAWSFGYLTVVPVLTPLSHILGLRNAFVVQDPGSIRLRDSIARIMTSPRVAFAAIYRNELDSSPVITILVIGQLLLLFCLWIGFAYGLSFASLASYQGRCVLIVAATAFLLLLLASGPEATARMRIPAMPFLAIVAGIGSAAIANRQREAPRPSSLQAE